MCKKILSFLLVGICLIATLTPIRALENSEDIGLTCDYAVAIDAKRNEYGSWNVYINGGRIDTGLDALEWAKKAESLGAGEIL